MKKALTRISIGLLVLLGAIYLVGYTLPVKHQVKQSIVLKVKPDKIWATITDFKSFKEWRSDITAIEIVDSSTWKETNEYGDVVKYQMVEKELNKKLRTQILNKDLPYGGAWTFILIENPESVELQITEDGEVYNPFFRFMSKFIFGHTATVELYLNDLDKKLAQKNL